MKYHPNGPTGPIIPKPDGGTLKIDDEIVLEGSCHWIRKRAAEVVYGWEDPAYTRSSEQARDYLKKVRR